MTAIYDLAILLTCSNKNQNTKELTYIGAVVTNYFSSAIKIVRLNGIDFPECDFGNAHIMPVPNNIVGQIGILSKGYNHGKRDYDHTMKAKKTKIPTFIGPKVCEHCKYDHDHSYVGREKMNFSQRKKSLFSPKDVGFGSQPYFNRNFFPLQYPIVWLFAYFKILFPKIYLKKN